MVRITQHGEYVMVPIEREFCVINNRAKIVLGGSIDRDCCPFISYHVDQRYIQVSCALGVHMDTYELATRKVTTDEVTATNRYKEYSWKEDTSYYFIKRPDTCKSSHQEYLDAMKIFIKNTGGDAFIYTCSECGEALYRKHMHSISKSEYLRCPKCKKERNCPQSKGLR